MVYHSLFTQILMNINDSLESSSKLNVVRQVNGHEIFAKNKHGYTNDFSYCSYIP